MELKTINTDKEVEYIPTDFANVGNNKKRSKKKAFNQFSEITTLVKLYKADPSEFNMLEVLKSLTGLVNTFTLLLTPGAINQQIYITPYMKRFLGMFLTKDEIANCTNESYHKATARIRWVMRKYTYEDIYSEILRILIVVIQKLRIVGDCDVFYYIQFIMKFKMHGFVVSVGKDVSSNLVDIDSVAGYNNFNTHDEEDFLDDVLDRLSYSRENINYEDSLIDAFYSDIDISVLIRKDDIFKCFSPYEKYLLYMFDYLGMSQKNISKVLKFETEIEITERFQDIVDKLELLKNE